MKIFPSKTQCVFVQNFYSQQCIFLLGNYLQCFVVVFNKSPQNTKSLSLAHFIWYISQDPPDLMILQTLYQQREALGNIIVIMEDEQTTQTCFTVDCFRLSFKMSTFFYINHPFNMHRSIPKTLYLTQCVSLWLLWSLGSKPSPFFSKRNRCLNGQRAPVYSPPTLRGFQDK